MPGALATLQRPRPVGHCLSEGPLRGEFTTAGEPRAQAGLGPALGVGLPGGEAGTVAFSPLMGRFDQNGLRKHRCYLLYPLGPHPDEVALKF